MYVKHFDEFGKNDVIVFKPLLVILPAIFGEWGIFVLQPVADMRSFCSSSRKSGLQNLKIVSTANEIIRRKDSKS